MTITIGLLERVRNIVRFRPHDTSTSHGRSNERYRRMTLTTIAALAARGIGLLTSLVTIPLTFRYLGSERYGLWMVLISLISAMGFADLGIGNGVMNAISEAYGKDDHELAREYVSSGLVLMLGIATFLGIAGAVAYPWISWQRVFNVHSAGVAGEGARAILVLFCWFLVNIPLDVITRAQAGLQRAYWSQTVSAAGNVLSLLAIIAVIALHGSLAWLVFASTFGVVVATIANGWILFREYPWILPSWRAFRAAAASKILKMGMMFFALQCAVTLGFTSDNIVIAQVLGAAAVAAYAVPQKLFSFVSMILNMAFIPLWPAYGEAAARGDVAWVRKTFFRSVWTALGVSVPLCTVLVFAGPWILRAFFGKALHASMALLIVLGLWGVISAVSQTMAVLLNGAGVLKPQVAIAMAMSVLNLLLSIALTRRFGVIGVCLRFDHAHLLITAPGATILIRRLFTRLERMSVADGFAGSAAGLGGRL